jgi:glycosyltransferase involved in cell wall biosynthesis
MKKRYLLNFIVLILNIHCIHAACGKKIVGLLQIRNEATLIEQCLHALSLYTDAIVILDDASDDNTLEIVESVADTYHIEKIVRNGTSAWEHRAESDNRQKLLDAGREIGGTHFLIIDADEMMTSNCATNNFLRNIILRLNLGDRLKMNIMHLWGSFDRYRTYFKEEMKYFIFCDDGRCYYIHQFLHVNRVPLNLSGGANLELQNQQYGLLHFGYVNWDNVLIRQAWYKCLERVRNSDKSIEEINSWYPAHKEKDATTFPVPQSWICGYTFFNPQLFAESEQWRMKQIVHWFNDMEIWHLDFPSN